MNRTNGNTLGFDFWLAHSRKNWLPQLQAKLNIPPQQIEDALIYYVSENEFMDAMEVLRMEEKKRSQQPSVILQPGQSIGITINFKQQEQL